MNGGRQTIGCLEGWPADNRLAKTQLPIDSQGQRPSDGADGYPRPFPFKSVKLGKYVVTIEGEGYAPQHRHIKIGPEAKPQDFLV